MQQHVTCNTFLLFLFLSTAFLFFSFLLPPRIAILDLVHFFLLIVILQHCRCNLSWLLLCDKCCCFTVCSTHLDVIVATASPKVGQKSPNHFIVLGLGPRSLTRDRARDPFFLFAFHLTKSFLSMKATRSSFFSTVSLQVTCSCVSYFFSLFVVVDCCTPLTTARVLSSVPMFLFSLILFFPSSTALLLVVIEW